MDECHRFFNLIYTEFHFPINNPLRLPWWQIRGDQSRHQHQSCLAWLLELVQKHYTEKYRKKKVKDKDSVNVSYFEIRPASGRGCRRWLCSPGVAPNPETMVLHTWSSRTERRLVSGSTRRRNRWKCRTADSGRCFGSNPELWDGCYPSGHNDKQSVREIIKRELLFDIFFN